LILLIGIFSSVTVLAQVSVGVKAGDWIEYEVSYIGTPPSPDDRITRIKHEVLQVDGTFVELNRTTECADGEQYHGAYSLAIQDKSDKKGGHLELIPANLSIGDVLFVSDYVGEVLVDRIVKESFAGSMRDVLYADHAWFVGFCWDRQTGFLLMETFDSERYSRVTVADYTNIWEVQISEPDSTEDTLVLTEEVSDQTMVYAVLILTGAIVTLILFFILRRKK